MDSTERVSLKGNSKGTLNVFHENATFTCEAKFNITVNVSGNTIVVCEDAGIVIQTGFMLAVEEIAELACPD